MLNRLEKRNGSAIRLIRAIRVKKTKLKNPIDLRAERGGAPSFGFSAARFHAAQDPILFRANLDLPERRGEVVLIPALVRQLH